MNYRDGQCTRYIYISAYLVVMLMPIVFIYIGKYVIEHIQNKHQKVDIFMSGRTYIGT